MIEVGIAGLPNAGKSTLFNALTKANASCAPYRFTTIKPNVGVAEIKDERLNLIAKVENSEKIIPAAIKFYDIAGLIEGAHKGEGLGNQFLSEIRTCDVICHCIRGFNLNSEPEPDIRKDADTVNIEFIYSDMELVQRRIEKIRKKAESGDRQSREELSVLSYALSELNNLVPLRKLDYKEVEKIKSYLPDLITLKPVLYVLNVEDPKSQFSNMLFEELKKLAAEEGAEAMMVAAKLQLELEEINDDDIRSDFAEEFGLYENAVSKVATACYKLGHLITFFTTANKICQAWELKENSNILLAAEKIHSDIAKGFIKAEIVNWNDLVTYGSFQAAREAGKVFIEGRDYIVQDGDVIFFKFNR
ncbi:MAG: redox-regulated ATPase YchF [Actinobacteria bacterium]|nr:redox-regulated ATPase YchF [Actinomycetota bacterium]